VDTREDKKLHDMIGFIGLRAQATAVGLLQLSTELKRAGVLDDASIGRITDAIAKEIFLSRPQSFYNEDFDANLRGRLNRLFSGEESLAGSSRASAIPTAK
jgi:hypothetical protein